MEFNFSMFGQSFPLILAKASEFLDRLLSRFWGFTSTSALKKQLLSLVEFLLASFAELCRLDFILDLADMCAEPRSLSTCLCLVWVTLVRLRDLLQDFLRVDNSTNSRPFLLSPEFFQSADPVLLGSESSSMPQYWIGSNHVGVLQYGDGTAIHEYHFSGQLSMFRPLRRYQRGKWLKPSRADLGNGLPMSFAVLQ